VQDPTNEECLLKMNDIELDLSFFVDVYGTEFVVQSLARAESQPQEAQGDVGASKSGGSTATDTVIHLLPWRLLNPVAWAVLGVVVV
jgi:hypothetical protein